MKRLGMERQLWERELTDAWPELVGPTLARRTRPGAVLRHTLVVLVDSPPWLNELARCGRRELLAKLQQRFGRDRIRSVRFTLSTEKD
jgi:predicted nucleic acid-binding Zn ribbon protein